MYVGLVFVRDYMDYRLWTEQFHEPATPLVPLLSRLGIHLWSLLLSFEKFYTMPSTEWDFFWRDWLNYDELFLLVLFLWATCRTILVVEWNIQKQGRIYILVSNIIRNTFFLIFPFLSNSFSTYHKIWNIKYNCFSVLKLKYVKRQRPSVVVKDIVWFV